MFPLYNIVFDIIASVVICVDFLGTHMASLVLFFKIGCDNVIMLLEQKQQGRIYRQKPNPNCANRPTFRDLPIIVLD
jgi:hypothetical protein